MIDKDRVILVTQPSKVRDRLAEVADSRDSKHCEGRCQRCQDPLAPESRVLQKHPNVPVDSLDRM